MERVRLNHRHPDKMCYLMSDSKFQGSIRLCGNISYSPLVLHPVSFSQRRPTLNRMTRALRMVNLELAFTFIQTLTLTCSIICTRKREDYGVSLKKKKSGVQGFQSVCTCRSGNFALLP